MMATGSSADSDRPLEIQRLFSVRVLAIEILFVFFPPVLEDGFHAASRLLQILQPIAPYTSLPHTSNTHHSVAKSLSRSCGRCWPLTS